MNLLDMGLEKRMLDVVEATSEDQFVKNAQDEYDKYYNILNEKYADDDLISFLESAVNRLRFAEAEAGYRMGLSDGMQLQQEVNRIAEGGM